MKRPWINAYGDRLPSEIDTTQYENVVDMLLEAAEKFEDKVAFSSFGNTLTFKDTVEFSRDFASYLQSVVGIEKGDRVALMAPNILAFPVAMLGVLRAGAIQVNVNPMYTPRELGHQLNDADVDTIIVFTGSTPSLAAVINDSSIKNVIVVALDDLVGTGIQSPPVHEDIGDHIEFSEALSLGSELPLQDVAINRDDLIFLQYTGGTTGVSKGSMLSHGNLIASMLQFDAAATEFVGEGSDTVLTAIPMYHIFALSINTLSFFRSGATNILIADGRDTRAIVAAWSNADVTWFTGVNTLFNALLGTPGFSELDFSRFRFGLGGGATIQAAVSEKWKLLTGSHIAEGYGLSETAAIVTINPLWNNEFSGTVGIPAPSTDVSIRNKKGQEVSAGEPGEICIKGPQVARGYWRREKATAECVYEDGFFRTGDVGVMDDRGYIKVLDRLSDMILVSGFNVYPAEIEGEVVKVDGVSECACVGVPDDKTGDAVKVFVVSENASLTAESLVGELKKSLAAYKVPKHVQFVDALPKSAVGKILRRKLRGHISGSGRGKLNESQ